MNTSETDKVSVIIPTYNRFKYLLNCINSIRSQTYKNIEIIVINDCSTQEEYYTYDWNKEGIMIIHMEKNSKQIFGYGCAGYVRNQGLLQAKGKYIAFCDDDDIWFPEKIDLQIKIMKTTGCKMSSTEGIVGNGIYDPSKHYKKYNSENCYEQLSSIYMKYGVSINPFPDIWTFDFIIIHNCIITSSLIMEKEIFDKVGFFKHINVAEDYDYWLRALRHTNSVYVKNICFYYDNLHGDGHN
jgi:glycosyltransferase involved in cell wall biosynthesis